MRPVVICPLHRPKDLPNLVANWRRQKVRGDLVVVENGEAVGACRAAGFSAAVVLGSDRHVSAALNVGLSHALADGYGHWTKWDADDYYGSDYLLELFGAFAAGHRFVGKSDAFVRLADGRLTLFTLAGSNQKVTVGFHGPTLSSEVWSGLPRFRTDLPQPWGEDTAWCDDMRTLGIDGWATSRWNFCYLRHPNAQHTYDIADSQLASYVNGSVWIVDSDDHVATVDRRKELGKLTEFLPDRSLSLTDHPAFQSPTDSRSAAVGAASSHASGGERITPVSV